MPYFLNPSSILQLFIAGTLGFVVAPHLSLVSQAGGRAMRFAAWTLALGLALDVTGPMLYRYLPVEPWRLFPPIIGTLFWGCLAWSVVGVIQSMQPKGLQ